MKAALILTLFIFFPLMSGAQDNHILTREQNREWIEDLKEQGAEVKLTMVRDRLLKDTAVHYETTSLPHGIQSSREKPDVRTRCRPLYIFLLEGKDRSFLIPNPDRETVMKTNSLLIPENISGVEIGTGVRETALYGSRASCGTITLNIISEEVFNRLKDLQVAR